MRDRERNTCVKDIKENTWECPAFSYNIYFFGLSMSTTAIEFLTKPFKSNEHPFRLFSIKKLHQKVIRFTFPREIPKKCGKAIKETQYRSRRFFFFVTL